MSNGHKWELLKWGDGRTHLAYWDAIHGQDVIFVFDDDKAFRREYVDGADEPVETEVNLIEALEEWLKDSDDADT